MVLVDVDVAMVVPSCAGWQHEVVRFSRGPV
jgi:hypothetical protein